MTYFAIQPADASVPIKISAALAELRDRPGAAPFHVHALIDGAFDEALLTRSKWSRRPKQSLYEHTPLEALDAAAPHLLSAPVDPGQQEGWLQEMFTACAGRPMLSIIASPLSAAALQAHLRPYLVARTADNLEWPVRWADTRVLPELIAVLEPVVRQHLLSPLHCWCSIARDGTPVSWPGAACSSPPSPAFDKLPLDDATFGRLIDLAEADAVLANIYDTQPDLLRQHSPLECHSRVARHLAIAGEWGIHDAPSRQHFSVLALCLANDFTEHPAMAALLQRMRDGADYRSEVAALPASFWQEAAA